jgi:transposase
LTKDTWSAIAQLLPAQGRRGGQWREHRTVINGILWKLRTGAPWRDLPERYGPWQTCADRLYRWRRPGRSIAARQLLAKVLSAADVSAPHIAW